LQYCRTHRKIGFISVNAGAAPTANLMPIAKANADLTFDCVAYVAASSKDKRDCSLVVRSQF
jgi:hypothetical protein